LGALDGDASHADSGVGRTGPSAGEVSHTAGWPRRCGWIGWCGGRVCAGRGRGSGWRGARV